jgi:cell wall assembly regulator SMI1
VTQLTRSLDALVSEHRALASPAGDFLRPGLPAGDVVAQLDGLGLPAPPDVVELYGWADGTNEVGWQADAGQAPFLRFLGDLTFPPLDAAAEWCRTAREMAESASFDSPEGLPAEAFWDPSWFPVFRLDRGEIAVSCLLDQPARVHEVIWDRPDERRTFPSLTAFIVAATADLRDRFVWLGDDRVLLPREVAALRRSAGGSGG